MRIRKILAAAVAATVLSACGMAQAPAKYSYQAQKAFIPKDLGEVYIGMPFRDFVKKIDISDASADTSLDYISLNIPFTKGSIIGLAVNVHGFSRKEMDAMTREVVVEGEGEDGYTRKEGRIDVSKIRGEGIVYAYYIAFEEKYDLRSWVMRTFGPDGDKHDPGNDYHFFDVQWTKKTSDGLDWLIRSFHEGDGRNLHLLGRISGTEWAID